MLFSRCPLRPFHPAQPACCRRLVARPPQAALPQQVRTLGTGSFWVPLTSPTVAGTKNTDKHHPWPTAPGLIQPLQQGNCAVQVVVKHRVLVRIPASKGAAVLRVVDRATESLGGVCAPDVACITLKPKGRQLTRAELAASHEVFSINQTVTVRLDVVEELRMAREQGAAVEQ